jgi:low molecular weight phosphotyrosine protein phosphatase
MIPSAGAYHIGDPPDHRTMLTLESNGIKSYRHKARKVCLADFDEFDYIFAMDQYNLQDLQRLNRGNSEAKAKVQLWGEYSGTGKAEEVIPRAELQGERPTGRREAGS